jgi:ABC-type Na+ efflux pump permease subunit
MSPSITPRSVMIGALIGTCLLSLSASLAVALAGGLEQGVTWLLGTELVAPLLIAGLAIILFWLRKSHYPWRY